MPLPARTDTREWRNQADAPDLGSHSARSGWWHRSADSATNLRLCKFDRRPRGSSWHPSESVLAAVWLHLPTRSARLFGASETEGERPVRAVISEHRELQNVAPKQELDVLALQRHFRDGDQIDEASTMMREGQPDRVR